MDQPRRRTKAERDLAIKHAGEQAAMQVDYENAQNDLLERQNRELRELQVKEREQAVVLPKLEVCPAK